MDTPNPFRTGPLVVGVTGFAPKGMQPRATFIFAVFLNALKAMPEGDGTLLDNCSVFATTELSEGNTHSNDEFPVLLAGRGGGRLRTGLHVRTNRDNASKAGLTALRGAGVPMPSFGYDAGRVSDPLAEILIG